MTLQPQTSTTITATSSPYSDLSFDTLEAEGPSAERY